MAEQICPHTSSESKSKGGCICILSAYRFFIKLFYKLNGFWLPPHAIPVFPGVIPHYKADITASFKEFVFKGKKQASIFFQKF